MGETNLQSHAPGDAFNQLVFAKMFRAGLTLAQGLGGFPVIETAHGKLRELRPEEDAKASVGVVPYGGNTKLTVEELRSGYQGVRDRFYDKQYVLFWAIARKEDDVIVGNVRYWEWPGHPESPFAFGTLQFDIAAGYEKLAAEAVRAAAEFGLRTLGLARVQWSVRKEADEKIKVMEAAGFVREGILRAWWYDTTSGQWIDELMYSLVPGDLKK